MSRTIIILMWISLFVIGIYIAASAWDATVIPGVKLIGGMALAFCSMESLARVRHQWRVDDKPSYLAPEDRDRAESARQFSSAAQSRATQILKMMDADRDKTEG
jgi:hypothetical protein